jgi:CIC family chloride channel protein
VLAHRGACAGAGRAGVAGRESTVSASLHAPAFRDAPCCLESRRHDLRAEKYGAAAAADETLGAAPSYDMSMESDVRLDEPYQRPLLMLVLSLVIGVIGAFAAVVFLVMLDFAKIWLLGAVGHVQMLSVADAIRLGTAPGMSMLNWWIPLATTLGGLISGVLVYSLAPEAEGHGTDGAVKAFHRLSGYIRGRVIIVKSIASAITIGSGGAAGREGPTAQIAAGIGSLLGRMLKLSDDEKRLLILTGMAAGLSAIFKSPLGTAIFAVEVLYSRMALEGRALPYTLAGSAVAFAVVSLFTGWRTLFVVPDTVTFNAPIELLWYSVLGLLSGLMGALVPNLFYGVRDGFRALPIPNHVKPAIGGLLVGVIALFLPQILGGGYDVIQFAVQGGSGMLLSLMLLLSVFKLLALSLTVGSGGSGGVFAPSLFVGALLGAAFGGLLQQLGISDVPTAGLAVVGMAAVFAGAARVPLASMVMVAEMTGGYKLMAPTMIAVVLSCFVQIYVTRFTRYPSLYEAQVPAPGDSPVYREAA